MIQSLQRAFLLIEAVAAAPQGLTLTQVAEQAGVHFRTVQGLLRSLKELGLLDLETQSKRYRLGPGVAMLMGSQSLSHILRPILQEKITAFAQSHQQYLAVATVDQGHIHLVCGYDPSQTRPELKERVLEETLSFCAGRVLLAHGQSPVWRGAADEVLQTLSASFQPQDGSQLSQLLADIREQGHHFMERPDKGRWRALLAKPLRYRGAVFATIGTNLEHADSSVGPSKQALHAWKRQHITLLSKLAQDIEATWYTPEEEAS